MHLKLLEPFLPKSIENLSFEELMVESDKLIQRLKKGEDLLIEVNFFKKEFERRLEIEKRDLVCRLQ